MANTYFTADLHFDHTNIIEYCKRPWGNANYMNEGLIKNYNARVQPEDTCYFLGDIGFCHAEYLYALLKRMNGRKILIFGNHDNVIRKNRELFEGIFEEMHDFLEVKVKDERLILCHYPLLAWPRGIMLHGHCHGTAVYPRNNFGDKRILDVGVDCHGYAPIGLDTVRSKVDTRINNLPEDEKKYYLKAK
jgi:calcineurin-like phosphoesterase family protein